MTSRTYASALAFKRALEDRLKQNHPGPSLARARKLIVFERFLARIALEFQSAATLKGGMAVELRLERARTTNDIDLLIMGSKPETLLVRLQAAVRRDLGDFLKFQIQPHPRHPEIQNEGLLYGGLRFQASCTLAGKSYGGGNFDVDVAFGGPIYGEPELLESDDRLGFARIKPAVVCVIPIETHIAEKLHAYTLPRVGINSRDKDLPDLALLATASALQATHLRAALEQTFSFRATHALPPRLPEPPESWAPKYQRMMEEEELPWESLDAVFRAVSAFLNPVLAQPSDDSWSAKDWCWKTLPP